jgi:hypothetical protein
MRWIDENLRDLNFEYKACKVPDADYQSTRLARRGSGRDHGRDRPAGAGFGAGGI